MGTVTERDPIIIVGAGPAGLAAATILALRDVPSIVLECDPALPRDLRAGSFHPPTMELLDTIGVAGDFRAMGIDPAKQNTNELGRPIKIADGEPIRALFFKACRAGDPRSCWMAMDVANRATLDPETHPLQCGTMQTSGLLLHRGRSTRRKCPGPKQLCPRSTT